MREEISALLDKWYDELNLISRCDEDDEYRRLESCIEELETIYSKMEKKNEG